MTGRRDILKGALIGGALGGFSSAQATAKSGSGAIRWDESFDVIVVGSGSAGMVGAVACKTKGIKNVVVLEKLPVMGGNSCIAVGDICAVDSSITRKAGIKDSVDQFVSDFTKAGGGYNHKDLSRAVGEWSGRGIDFLISQGCEFTDELMQHFGHSARRIHHPIGGCARGVLAPLRKTFIEKYQGEIRTRTKMDEIIKDGQGRVIGIKVRERYDFDPLLKSDDLENKSGIVKYYRARRGVLMAYGGYARDPVWRKEDFPMFNPQMVEMASLGATSGGLRSMMQAGARPFGLSFMRLGFDLAGGDVRFTCLVHPKTGKRYINEALPRDPLAEASVEIADATGAFPVAIVDSECLKHFEDQNRNKRQLKLGSLREYPTLEALCEAQGLPTAAVKQTIERYNAMVKKNADEDFGKDFKRADHLPIEKAPFYASPLIPRANNTVGGVLVTPKAEVRSVRDGQPIPGLYAAGECACGMHGKASLPSSSIVVSVTFGLIAAEQLARSTVA